MGASVDSSRNHSQAVMEVQDNHPEQNWTLIDADLFKDIYFLMWNVCFAKCKIAFPWKPFFISGLRDLNVSKSSTSFSKISQICGAKNETDSVPYLIEFTLRLFRKLLLRKL